MGTQVDRYVLLEEVGRGGMGEVYAAYDPELDRKIALKVMSTRGEGSEGPDAGEARLLREAQALAKLSHPNVVSVHDAGTAGGRLFIAMEFIEGMTLRQWIDAGPRSVPEIVELLLAAGRGLAAAHGAGLVHRDFKPQNVMVRADGEVRVLDFGLARRIDGPATVEPSRDGHPASGSGSWSSPLTQTGMVHGTPAYMAPEQFAAGDVDARTDQFAFCIVAYECLYGERPFSAPSYRELSKAVARGEIADTPKGRGVSPRLRRVLLRGLSSDPAQRYPDIDALLRSLRDAATPRWRRVSTLGVGVGVTAVLGAAAIPGGESEAGETPCSGAADTMGQVWNDARRAEIGEAFAGLELPYATPTWERVDAKVEGWSGEWVTMRDDACEATRVRGEQSEELMDKRVACLDRHLAELSALTAVLSEPDATVAERAPVAAASLSPIAECSADGVLRSSLSPPEDPELRARVLAADSVRAAADIKLKAGRFAEAIGDLEGVLQEAATLGYEPLIAHAHYDMGTARLAVSDPVSAREEYYAALSTAVACDHEQIELRTHISLIGTQGAMFGEIERGRDHARLAEALSRRVDGGPTALGMLDVFMGMLEIKAGNPEKALAHFEKAVEIRKAAGDETLNTVAIDINAATAEQAMGRYDDAIARLVKAIGALEAVYGDHPSAATGRLNLGGLYIRTGDETAALKELEHAIEVLDRVSKGPSLHLAQALQNRSVLLLHEGRLDEAEAALTRAVQTKRAVVGPDNFSTAVTEAALADVMVRRGRYADALAAVEPLFPKLEQGDGAGYAEALLTKSEALLRLSRFDEADAAAAEALQRYGEAGPKRERAEGLFFRAQAQSARPEATDAERAEAMGWAEQAQGFYVELGAAHADHQREVADWIAKQ